MGTGGDGGGSAVDDYRALPLGRQRCAGRAFGQVKLGHEVARSAQYAGRNHEQVRPCADCRLRQGRADGRTRPCPRGYSVFRARLGHCAGAGCQKCGRTGVVRRCETQGSIGSRRSGTGENGGGYAQQYARNATRFRQCAVHVSQYARICARHQRRLCENVYRYRCGRSRVGHQRNRTRAGRLCNVRQRRVVSARLSDDGKYPPQPLCRVGGTVCR
ncbi:Uncharacterised protein [Neisseria meningitidis]|nr:Uncharacterised protein [Neisseria meningitidis]CWP46049.1 Uncharacterised protein [Neisseria meningitidis]